MQAHQIKRFAAVGRTATALLAKRLGAQWAQLFSGYSTFRDTTFVPSGNAVFLTDILALIRHILVHNPPAPQRKKRKSAGSQISGLRNVSEGGIPSLRSLCPCTPDFSKINVPPQGVWPQRRKLPGSIFCRFDGDKKGTFDADKGLAAATIF